MNQSIKTNYHTHYSICRHAEGSVDEYINRAIKLGYKTLAITEHIPFPKEMTEVIISKRMYIDQLDDYINEINSKKEEYKNKIEILLGLECEYLDFLEPLIEEVSKKCDFLILGQHYIKVKNKYKSIYNVSEENYLDIYFSTAHRALSTGLFKIFAHPDIFLWKVKDWNPYLEKKSKELIECAIKNNVLIELNTNGIRFGYRKEKYFYYNNKKVYCYPNYYFLKLANDLGAKIILNDDAHDPNDLHDESTLEGLSLANELKIPLVTNLEE